MSFTVLCHGRYHTDARVRLGGTARASRDTNFAPWRQQVTLISIVNMKQRYVASTLCPIGQMSQPECVELANHIFDCDADAAKALVEHLTAAECHTRQELARIVGNARAYTHSYRLVYENHVGDGYAA